MFSQQARCLSPHVCDVRMDMRAIDLCALFNAAFDLEGASKVFNTFLQVCLKITTSGETSTFIGWS